MCSCVTPCRKDLGQVEDIVKGRKGRDRRSGKSAPKGRPPYSPTVHAVNSFCLKPQCSTDTSPFDMRRRRLYRTVPLPLRNTTTVTENSCDVSIAQEIDGDMHTDLHLEEDSDSAGESACMSEFNFFGFKC